jgi:drug/metabolite transporter (DMT)-like permease
VLAYLLGIGIALASASCYSVGVLLQSLEARDVPDTQSLRLSLIKSLVSRKRWVLGTACVILGWFLQAAALGFAPLTVVQPALAVGLFVLLIAGDRLSNESVGRREVLAVVAISVGVAGLGLASPKSSEGGSATATVIAPALAAFAMLALAPYLLRRRRLPFSVVISAGVAYATSGFLTKFVADAFSAKEIITGLAWLGGTVVAALIGLVSEMTALQKRSAIRVFPGVLVIQIVLAVLCAPLLAGEKWSTDPLLLAVLGASLIVLAAGTAVLASAGAVAAVVDSSASSKASDSPPAVPSRDPGDHSERSALAQPEPAR